jgi:hypothetical protein
MRAAISEDCTAEPPGGLWLALGEGLFDQRRERRIAEARAGAPADPDDALKADHGHGRWLFDEWDEASHAPDLGQRRQGNKREAWRRLPQGGFAATVRR